MDTFFNPLFDYNFYCNKKLIEQFVDADIQLTDKHVVWFSHILNTHHIWNARILGLKSKYEVFQKQQKEDFFDIHYDNQRSSFEIITNTKNFDTGISYENSQGKHFVNTIHDILFHIINHSTYHRGQIATESRANGIEPLPLDYIQYKR
ncbi:damage-inducible protein DinB [Cellulophaga sp. HaHaR_3_176]|uniref:DinB family protein n=1 Tax=Cellulophaga sp. HaHaR_3_176 TaxID=1942464 RepID=UPI001C1FBBE0|nr:DinB family protein [Cellulophaga sp. HaHaR_3_176]QWX83801.1 damage-inducible protein DinB [Cellulophaga sp. HaHaR_3_176]